MLLSFFFFLSVMLSSRLYRHSIILSSRSCMHSSVSFSLLLIESRVLVVFFFISYTRLFSIDWVFFLILSKS